MRLKAIPVAMLVLLLYAIFVFAAKGQQFSVLGSFNGMNGAQPQGTLIQGSDGDFYGITYKGGPGNYGTVFKVTHEGVVTTLHAFTFEADGAYPVGGLVEGIDGSFYGTVFVAGYANGMLYSPVFPPTAQ